MFSLLWFSSSSSKKIKNDYYYSLDFSSVVYLILFNLNTENYLVWKEKIQFIMEGQGIESHITDDPSDQDSQEGKIGEIYLTQKKNVSLIKSWIRGTLMEDVLYLVSGLSIGKPVWKLLKEAFASERPLITRLLNRKDSSSIATYIKCFKCICDELATTQKPIYDDDKKKEQGTGKILATGSRNGDFYSLDLTNPPASALFAKSSGRHMACSTASSPI